MAHLQTTRRIAPEDPAAAAGMHGKYEPQFLADVPGSLDEWTDAIAAAGFRLVAVGGDEILDAMPAGDTPGRRSAVAKYQVAYRMTA